MDSKRSVPVLIVGAGFSGINLGVLLRKQGFDDFLIIDRGHDFGGTWWSNTYPGAECDIQSHLYSFSFSPNPYWSKTYATQPEIHAYLTRVALDAGLYSNVDFGQNVEDAYWDDARGVWVVTTSSGIIETRMFIVATGHLSDPKLPQTAGIEKFSGHMFHSATWDHDYDLSGKRVAVVGTGASAIQVVPAIVDTVTELKVFQRSAPYVVPRLDTVYSDVQKAMFEKMPTSAAEFREFLFWSNENRFLQRLMVPQYLAEVNQIATTHRESQLTDPELLRKTTPDYTIGCKRILLSNTWYPALERDHVELIDQPFAEFSERGIIDGAGEEHEIDCVIFCSGFEAAELPIAQKIRGRGGQGLHEVWSQGSQAFGGMAVAGFPNMFLMNGPHVGLGAGSIIFMIETQASYISQGIELFREQRPHSLEVKEERQSDFLELLAHRAAGTVWTQGDCRSWYLDDRSGLLTTIWPDQMNRFHALFQRFDASDYDVLAPVQLEAV